AIHSLLNQTANVSYDYEVLATYFHTTDQLDSSLIYAQKAYAIQINTPSQTLLLDMRPLLAAIYFEKGNYPLAIQLSRQAIQNISARQTNESWLAYFTLSEYFLQNRLLDSSLFYAKK